jgi:hypothetical protein
VNVLDEGDRFISTLDDNGYCVGNYHAIKQHSATVQRGTWPWDKTDAKSAAGRGHWAIIHVHMVKIDGHVTIEHMIMHCMKLINKKGIH